MRRALSGQLHGGYPADAAARAGYNHGSIV